MQAFNETEEEAQRFIDIEHRTPITYTVYIRAAVGSHGETQDAADDHV